MKNEKTELTQAQQIEYDKCVNDPVYFFETYCKLLTSEGLKNVKLTKSQKELLLANGNVSSLSERQSGTTIAISAKNLHLLLFKENIHIGVATTNGLYLEMINKMRTMFDNLPSFLKKHTKSCTKNAIVFLDGNSIIKCSQLGCSFNYFEVLDGNFLSTQYADKINNSFYPCAISTNATLITNELVNVKHSNLFENINNICGNNPLFITAYQINKTN